jgi:hypothetical protein
MGLMRDIELACDCTSHSLNHTHLQKESKEITIRKVAKKRKFFDFVFVFVIFYYFFYFFWACWISVVHALPSLQAAFYMEKDSWGRGREREREDRDRIAWGDSEEIRVRVRVVKMYRGARAGLSINIDHRATEEHKQRYISGIKVN